MENQENQKWYGPNEWAELLEQVLWACKHTDFRTERSEWEFPDDPFHDREQGLVWAEKEFEEFLSSLAECAKEALGLAEWWASAADDLGWL